MTVEVEVHMFAIKQTARRILRTRLASLAILGLAATTAACSGGAATATSPSGVSPVGLDADPPSSSRSFSVSVSPASVTVGAAALTVTVTNTSVVSNPQTAALGSIRIEMPSALHVTSISAPAASKWTYLAPAGQTMTLGSKPGSNKLLPGESVTFTVNITTTICGKYDIPNPGGSNEAPATYSLDPNWAYSGSALSVEVTGCTTTCDAPEAPSISHHYFTAPVSEGGLGLPANDDRHNLVQVAVAHEQAEDKTFHGLSPCDPGFAAEVKAFVDQVMASL